MPTRSSRRADELPPITSDRPITYLSTAVRHVVEAEGPAVGGAEDFSPAWVAAAMRFVTVRNESDT